MQRHLPLVAIAFVFSLSPFAVSQPLDLRDLFSSTPGSRASATTWIPTSAVVYLSSTQILLNGRPIVDLGPAGLVPEATMRGSQISPLYAALQDDFSRFESLVPGARVKGFLVIDADPEIPFSLSSKIMYTASQAGYTTFLYIVGRGNGVFQYELPGIGRPKSDIISSGDTPQALAVLIEEDRLCVSNHSDVTFAVNGQDAPSSPVCMSVHDDDLSTVLNAALLEVNERFLDVTTVTVLFDAHTPYAPMTEILAAVSVFYQAKGDVSVTFLPKPTDSPRSK